MLVTAPLDGTGQQEPVTRTFVNLRSAEVKGGDRHFLSTGTSFGLRGDDPIVLTGKDLPMLHGTALDRIVAFRFHNGWEQIPVQIDERKMINIAQARKNKPCGLEILVYADAGTLVGADDDLTFDADDELVFMAADAGELAPASSGWPAGTIAHADVSLRLLIRDPVGGAAAYVYLFLSDGTPQPSCGA